MADYSDLIARLEKAEGPDQELDARIIAALLAPPSATVAQSPINFRWCIYNGERNGHPRLWETPAGFRADHESVTASLDAAIALTEKMLPRWSLRLSLGEGYRFPCVLMGRSYPFNATVAVEHSTSSPMAVLLAMLHALRHESLEQKDAA